MNPLDHESKMPEMNYEGESGITFNGGMVHRRSEPAAQRPVPPSYATNRTVRYKAHLILRQSLKTGQKTAEIQSTVPWHLTHLQEGDICSVLYEVEVDVSVAEPGFSQAAKALHQAVKYMSQSNAVYAWALQEIDSADCAVCHAAKLPDGYYDRFGRCGAHSVVKL